MYIHDLLIDYCMPLNVPELLSWFEHICTTLRGAPWTLLGASRVESRFTVLLMSTISCENTRCELSMMECSKKYIEPLWIHDHHPCTRPQDTKEK